MKPVNNVSYRTLLGSLLEREVPNLQVVWGADDLHCLILTFCPPAEAKCIISVNQSAVVLARFIYWGLHFFFLNGKMLFLPFNLHNII